MSQTVLRLGDDGLPLLLRWRVVVRIKPLLAGLLIDLALEVILQQAGVQTFESWQMLRALGVGVLLGIVMPSAGFGYAVRRANREIREARAAAAGGGAPGVVAQEAREAHAAGRAAVDLGASRKRRRDDDGSGGREEK